MKEFIGGAIFKDKVEVDFAPRIDLRDIKVFLSSDVYKKEHVLLGIGPKDDCDFWTDPDSWEVILDSNYLPTWFKENEEELLAKFRKEVRDWWEEHVLIDKTIGTLDQGLYLLKRCRVDTLIGDVCVRLIDSTVHIMCGGSKVLSMYGSSTVGEMRHRSTVHEMHDSSSVRDMYDNSKVYEMHHNSKVCEMCDNSKVCKMYDNSMVWKMGNKSTVQKMFESSKVCEMYGNSKVCEMHDNSTIMKMDDDSIVLGLYDNTTVHEMYCNAIVRDHGNKQIKISSECQYVLVKCDADVNNSTTSTKQISAF